MACPSPPHLTDLTSASPLARSSILSVHFGTSAGARCCPSDRQPLAPRRQPLVTGDGRMLSLHASRCSTCPYFLPVPVPPWRRQCRTRPSRDASVERTTTTTTTTMHVIGSVAAIKMMFGTATIGPAQTHPANRQYIKKEIKPVAAVAVMPVPLDYRSA